MEAVDPKLVNSTVSRITPIIPLYTWNVYIMEISLDITFSAGIDHLSPRCLTLLLEMHILSNCFHQSLAMINNVKNTKYV